MNSMSICRVPKDVEENAPSTDVHADWSARIACLRPKMSRHG